jgi:nicotinate phosphoribosyltransferase
MVSLVEHEPGRSMPPMHSWPATSSLLADLYQFTMLQAYFDRRMFAPAVFELFVRKLPPVRNFLLAAGLEQAVAYLRTLRIAPREIEALRATSLFHDEFLAWLADLRFTGDLDAMAEGTIAFPHEPLLRIMAPLPEAQLVESRLVNLVHFATTIASKAARCVLAAPGKTLVDFGMRRAHGAEAALLAARAAYLAGFAGTATTLANPAFGIPIFGTMAHSFVQAHDTEVQAFEHFLDSHRGSVVLLIDTYDTVAAAHRVVELAKRRPDKTIAAVRLDSGDLDALSREVRQVLDEAGVQNIDLFASGNLDEGRVQALVTGGAPIDGFGIGTSLDVASDCPALDCAYKLQAYAGRPRRKRSPGKANWPGAKQVFRQRNARAELERDVLAPVGETHAGEPLLRPVLRHGELVAPLPSLAACRERAAVELRSLPPGLRSLAPALPYRVEIAPSLEALAARVDAEFR